jgi:hypothetical protein
MLLKTLKLFVFVKKGFFPMMSFELIMASTPPLEPCLSPFAFLVKFVFQIGSHTFS